MSRPGSLHETFCRDEMPVDPPTRSLGIMCTLLFGMAGLFPLWRGGPVRTWALVVGAIFLALTLLLPRVLRPVGGAWVRLGSTMHRVMNPAITAVVFYGIVTPFAILARVVRRSVVRQWHQDPAATTYWISCAGQAVSRMDRQF